ncbi:MAG: metal ABC transporter permease [Solirubrobacterales bacterium]
MGELLIEPFSSEFMRTGVAAAMVVGAMCAVVGTFVVIRGTALLADSLAHGVLPGVAVAVVIGAGNADPGGLGVLLGALAGALVTAVGTAAILRRSGLRDDTSAALMFVFMLALGVVLISRVSNYAVNLNALLFGDVLSVQPADLAVTALLAAGVGVACAALYRPIVMVSFDRRRAASLGLPVARVELAVTVLLAVAVVIGFRVVGALLVLGLLIAPPAAAALVTRRIPSMMAAAAALAVASAPVGMLVSWHLDVAAGAAIVLVAVSACLAVVVVRPGPGR